MIDSALKKVDLFTEGKTSKYQFVNQRAQTFVTPNPKGSLFEGFSVGNWVGSPIHQPGEHEICYLA